jgi:hypothetical protein
MSPPAGSPPFAAALTVTMIMNRILSNLHRCVEVRAPILAVNVDHPEARGAVDRTAGCCFAGYRSWPLRYRLIHCIIRAGGFLEAEMITSAAEKLVGRPEMTVSSLGKSVCVVEIVVSTADIIASCI